MSKLTISDLICPINRVCIGTSYSCCPVVEERGQYLLDIKSPARSITVGPMRHEAIRSFMRKGYIDNGDHPHIRYIVPEVWKTCEAYCIDSHQHVALFVNKFQLIFTEQPEHPWQYNALTEANVYVCNNHKHAWVVDKQS